MADDSQKRERRARSDRRESGQPGGGAGRRDDVGKSGVYPASGPMPAGPAELRQPAAWGQGERGAAGYEDSGRSELVYEHGEVLGGLDTGAPGSPSGPVEETEIPAAAWREALDDFSRRHRDCAVEIVESQGPVRGGGENLRRKVQVSDLPLKGVSADHAGERDKIYVSVGERPEEEFTHVISSPRRVLVGAGGGDQVEIETADGSRTLVRCRGHKTKAA